MPKLLSDFSRSLSTIKLEPTYYFVVSQSATLTAIRTAEYPIEVPVQHTQQSLILYCGTKRPDRFRQPRQSGECRLMNGPLAGPQYSPEWHVWLKCRHSERKQHFPASLIRQTDKARDPFAYMYTLGIQLLNLTDIRAIA
jgi:hypothetical protein